MKILMVNTSDIKGGAARAAYRLHRSLLESGVDSQMLVQNKASDDIAVLAQESKVKRAINLLRPTLDSLPIFFYKNRTTDIFCPVWLPFSKVIKLIDDIDPDIVHFHGICGGMLRIEELSKIKMPIIWSLHDNWLFTGGCRVMLNCERYKESCGACPQLGSAKENDLSRSIFERKRNTLTKINNMTIVGLSQWIVDCSTSSTLLKEKEHLVLPNPINTETFKPFDKEKARELWGFHTDKKLVLFGAMNPGSLHKGFKELHEALSKLDNHNLELIIFGSSEPKQPINFSFKTHYVGHLHDDISLVTLYSAVDVMVVPSLQENLSNAIMESLACGTPVVGFNIGGNSDMIEHKITGYLAKPFDTEDLKSGIQWVLNSTNYDELSKNAREKVFKEFDSQIVAQKYIKLYEKVLSDN